MSIYGTIPGIDADSPCGPPWIYQGSHILPAEEDQRGGEIALLSIASHITRDGRDNQPEDGRPWPWLRITTDGDLVINPAQARHLAAQLIAWADEADGEQPADDDDEDVSIPLVPASITDTINRVGKDAADHIRRFLGEQPAA